MDLSILAKLDQTIAACPCGATPDPGAEHNGRLYCGADCTPTHTSGDTDPSRPGSNPLATPMRWAPDMVSEAPDEGLGTALVRTRRGPFNGTVYLRVSTDRWHLRLDDGLRFVGVDIDRLQPDDEEAFIRRRDEAWASLEKQLTSRRHTVPDEQQSWPHIIRRWEEVWSDATSDPLQDIRDWRDELRTGWAGWEAAPANCPDGQVLVGFDGCHDGSSFVVARRGADGRIVIDESHLWSVEYPRAGRAIAAMTEAFRPLRENLDRLAVQIRTHLAEQADPEPTDPMARALWLRRHRNTGPQPAHRRGPRTIDAPRRRR